MRKSWPEHSGLIVTREGDQGRDLHPPQSAVGRGRDHHRAQHYLDEEVEFGLRAVAAQSGGVIWIGDPGTGKSELLRRVVLALESDASRPMPFFLHVTAGAMARDRFLGGSSAERIGELIGSVGKARTIVAIVSDIDLAAAASHALLLELASERHPHLVLLGTSRTAPAGSLARAVQVRPIRGMTSTQALEFLTADHGIQVAPRVAAHLARSLGGNPGSILEMAQTLSHEQLVGVAATPDPLPLTPMVRALLDDRMTLLDTKERATLLVAAVAVVDRTQLLCAASRMDLDRILGGALCEFLRLVSGTFTIVDPRVRSYVHATASVGERTDAHLRLAEALTALGEDRTSAWHTSLAALDGSSEVTRSLLGLARDALHRGDSVWAFAIAREAASQASARGPRSNSESGAEERRSAEYLAGIAALHSGYVDDAVDWLNKLMRSGDFAWVAKALSPFIVSVTLSRGYVPEMELMSVADRVSERRRNGEDGPAVSRARSSEIAEAFAAAAAMHAERGDLECAERSLSIGRGFGERSRGSSWALAAAREWCMGFGLAPTECARPSTGSSVGHESYSTLSRALGFAGRREWSPLAALLASSLLALTPANRDSGVIRSDEPAATPLLEAHLRVAKALVDITVGGLARAKDELELAAFLLPISLPFAGLGVAAIRRVGILVEGRPSPAASALSAISQFTNHSSLRGERLVDDAFLASFAGHPSEAAALMGLAKEQLRGSARSVFSLPVPDEARLWLAANAPGESDRQVSVYDRACTELEVARTLAATDDIRGTRAHLLSASELFLQSGATAASVALQSAVTSGARHPGPAQSAPELILVTRVDNDIESTGSRAHWMLTLTGRESDIATRVVQGRANRDIARDLHLSVRTVETHLGRVFTKLGVHSRTQLGHLAHQAYLAYDAYPADEGASRVGTRAAT